MKAALIITWIVAMLFAATGCAAKDAISQPESNTTLAIIETAAATSDDEDEDAEAKSPTEVDAAHGDESGALATAANEPAQPAVSVIKWVSAISG